MEQEISGISKFPEKQDNLERWTEIFETNFRKISVPFDFEPEFSEILAEWNPPTTSPKKLLLGPTQSSKNIWAVFIPFIFKNIGLKTMS